MCFALPRITETQSWSHHFSAHILYLISIEQLQLASVADILPALTLLILTTQYFSDETQVQNRT